MQHHILMVYTVVGKTTSVSLNASVVRYKIFVYHLSQLLHTFFITILANRTVQMYSYM